VKGKALTVKGNTKHLAASGCAALPAMPHAEIVTGQPSVQKTLASPGEVAASGALGHHLAIRSTGRLGLLQGRPDPTVNRITIQPGVTGLTDDE
jgi:hypothetical protein